MTEIEQRIPFEKHRERQSHLPFIEELDKILSVCPELVEFVIYPNDDMVDILIDWATYCVITERQYHLLVGDDPSLDKNFNKDDDNKASSLQE